MIGKALVLLVAVCGLVLASAACGGTQLLSGDSAATDQREAILTPVLRDPEKGPELDGAVARAGDAEARTGGGAVARAGDARASTREAATEGEVTTEGNGGEDRLREVTLKVAGDPGTTFSGACSTRGREYVIQGRVPKRYSYQPGDGKLECEIRKDGGTLKIVVIGEGVHSEQRSTAGESTLTFTLSRSGAYSTSSTSVNQNIGSSDRSFSDGSP